jgi:periplasmic divalent cation tolerance protein
MAASFLQVMTTVDSEQEAEQLAAGVVEARLAACAQVIGPITSTYRWRGKVERASEWLCLIKTGAAGYDALEAHLLERHSYDTPEITATPIERGGAAYLAWIAAETGA